MANNPDEEEEIELWKKGISVTRMDVSTRNETRSPLRRTFTSIIFRQPAMEKEKNVSTTGQTATDEMREPTRDGRERRLDWQIDTAGLWKHGSYCNHTPKWDQIQRWLNADWTKRSLEGEEIRRIFFAKFQHGLSLDDGEGEQGDTETTMGQEKMHSTLENSRDLTNQDKIGRDPKLKDGIPTEEDDLNLLEILVGG
jgi:hypothetical protein